jgi:asparaginyl-tRNA synthetase
LEALEGPESLDSISNSFLTIRHPRMKIVLKIQSTICNALRRSLAEQGFLEVLAPIIGPCTDPGIRGAKQATVDYYGRTYKVMSSAILYKQMVAASLGKIYFFSPNIRLEPLETVKTRRHLCEFFQVDVEEAGASYLDAMSTAERVLHDVCEAVLQRHESELAALKRHLSVSPIPYRRMTHREAVDLLISDGHDASHSEELSWTAEETISGMFDSPFFVCDYPKGSRGFYDREDPERPGILRDFDMIYPEGFGEAVSGAERECNYETVVHRMRSSGENPESYEWYMEMLRRGVPPTAGFGIGVERLTRYVCGLRSVWAARPFPKVAGIWSP